MFLNLKTVENIRDLGGTPTKDGKCVKKGLLLRSGDLHRLSEAEFQFLKEQYHLKMVIDFRSNRSFVGKRDRIDETVECCHFITLNYLEYQSYDRTIPVSPREFFIDIYRSLATKKEAFQAYRAFFKCILRCEDGAVLWHCTSGKDRTGIAAALLLYALGCDMETIYKSHMETNEYTRELWEEKKREIDLSDPKEVEFYEIFYLAQKEFLDVYFEEICASYGSVDRFLEDEMNLTEDKIHILRKRYLE